MLAPAPSAETCNGVDDDCDTDVDEGASDAITYYIDYDGDGFGATGPYDVDACAAPAGYVDADGDCDDRSAISFPGADEVCDQADNDCDGEVDEDLTFDFDDDGFTTPGSCEGSGDDCDDLEETINPGADEECDGFDNNCDGNADEGLTFDLDGDGFTSDGSCEGSADDCDDDDAAVHVDADEVCDGVDNDCDGAVDDGFDRDGDGVTV